MKEESNTPRLRSTFGGSEPPLSRGELYLGHGAGECATSSRAQSGSRLRRDGQTRMSDLLTVLVITTMALLFGCAKDIAPPGGPADITPPDILESIPAPGAIQVNVNDPIVIEFSERINAKSVGNALFISPPLREEPRLRVKGSRLRIIPSEPLDSGKTYVVTLGSSVSDLNGNKLKNSLTLAFSTGDLIDSGVINGRIFEKQKPLSNFRIFAFKQQSWLTDSLFTIPPDYITESGDDGQFTFEFVKQGEYLVIGVEDKDRDNKISSFGERVGIPVTTTLAHPAGQGTSALALHASRYDSSMISLASCIGYSGRVVMQFSGGKLDPESVNADSIDVLTTQFELSAPISATVTEKEPDKLFIWSQRFIGDSIVTVTAHALRGQDDKRVDSTTTECTIRIRGLDTEPPDVLRPATPTNFKAVYPHDSLTLSFSEPVLIPDSALKIIVDSVTTIGARAIARTANRYAILPADSLTSDRRFKLQVNLQAITDLYGNHPKDTTYLMEFLIAGPDSMGQLTGTINCEHEPTVTVTFTGLARKIVYRHAQSSSGRFSLTMYPDQYTVTAFSDRNHNGRWDYGSLAPFNYAEPGWIVPDTLRIRARFDTEGFDLELK